MSANAYVLDHVAIGVPDIAPVPEIVVGALGGLPAGAGPGAGFLFWQWEFARGARLEILEPNGPADGFLHRFVEQRGPGVHHVTFKVPEIHAAMQRASALGYEIVGFDDTWPGWKEAFLHPKQAQGIVVQLAESNPELEFGDQGESGEPGESGEQGGSGSWAFPDAPSTAPPPAELLGLCMTATSADAARRQWQDALGGGCEESADGLVFHWPESPLRVRVRVDASAAPGPLGIEIVTGSPLPPAERTERVLGTRFFFATE